MGGRSAKAPKPSKEERALQEEQTKLLTMQRDLVLSQQRQQQVLLPLLGKQLGLEFKLNDKGEIIGATQTKASLEEEKENENLRGMQRELLELQLKEQQNELDPKLNARKHEIERLLEERTLSALKGTLPVDPALERDIREQRLLLNQRLKEQFGPGFETSSPAIETLAKFDESVNVLRSQARRGELTLSEQLGSVRAGLGFQQAGVAAGSTQLNLPGIFGAGTQPFLKDLISSPSQAAGGLGQVAAGLQMPIGQFMTNRQMQLQASVANSQQPGFGEILGGIAGSIAGGAASTLPFPWV